MTRECVSAMPQWGANNQFARHGAVGIRRQVGSAMRKDDWKKDIKSGPGARSIGVDRLSLSAPGFVLLELAIEGGLADAEKARSGELVSGRLP